VLLDLTILGIGFTAEATRTGIFRATEGLVGAMLARDDITVSISSGATWVSELQLLTYIRERQPRLRDRMVLAWQNPTASEAEATALIRRILAREAAGEDSRRDRAALNLLNATARRSPIGPFDVVHSLRTGLPDRDRVRARVRVLTVHDLIPLAHPEWCTPGGIKDLTEILASASWERDFCIVNSKATAIETTEILGIPVERVFVTPFAAQPGIFRRENDPEVIARILARYGVPPGPYLLALGTLEPRKNLSHLIRSFYRLVDSGDPGPVKLVLVGPTGWKTEELLSTIGARPELRNRIVLTGYVEDEDLAAIYSGARAFVFPSHYEGFGLPVLEAMRCGTPVIASNAGALPEVGGDAAVYVSPDDSEALGAAMRSLLSDSNRRADLSRRGIAHAEGFTWERTAALTVSAYRQMLP
jgi:glycosyltransferase involved in cell wall biosynthesis